MSATLNDDVQALKELVLHNPVSIRGIASVDMQLQPLYMSGYMSSNVILFLHWLCFDTVEVYSSRGF